MRLRAHLTLLVVAALAPIVILCAISLNKVRERHREAVLASVQETARATSLVIDRELAVVKTSMRALAASESLAQGDYERFRERAITTMKAVPGWTILFDNQARQLVNTRMPLNATLPPRAVNLTQFEELLTHDDFHVSSLTWAGNVQRHVVLLEMPVRHDERVMVLSHAILPEYFSRAFAERDIPATWIVTLFDRDGTTLASSDRANRRFGQQADTNIREIVRGRHTGVMRHETQDGTSVYNMFVHSPLSGWTVGISAPVAEIDGVVNQAALISGLGLLSAILTATLAAWLIGRRISRSVQGAVRSAATLGRGELPEPVPRSGVSEIDNLHPTLQNSGRMLAQERAQRQAAEAERNALLHREQQARREAERQNDAKDRFLAMLGHELRNPLAAITSAGEVLNLENLAGRGHSAVQILRRQTGHLGRMVDDLLDVSRVMSGKIQLERQPFDLSGLASGCVATLRSIGRTERHVLTLSALKEVWVEADPARIEQVITNLLDNAVKYTPAGAGIRIEVQAEDGQALLRVRDSGIGIPAELQPLIFDVFVQGERALDRAQGGLGIGLALARQLARLHDGDVECHSGGIDAGSCFTLRLPLAQRPGPLDGDMPEADKRASNLLLVDDHADARAMTAVMLEKLGHRLRVAEGAQEAIRLALEERPDLALVDIGMPDVDGYALARAMRARPELAGMLLVALTGYGTEDDRARSVAAGFDLHIVKPLTERKLAEVFALLDKNPAA